MYSRHDVPRSTLMCHPTNSRAHNSLVSIGCWDQATLGTDYADPADTNPEDFLRESYAQGRARARSSALISLQIEDGKRSARDSNAGTAVQDIGESDAQYRNRHKPSATDIAAATDAIPEETAANSPKGASSMEGSDTGTQPSRVNYVDVLRGKNDGLIQTTPMPLFTSLGVFTVDNPLRKWLYSVVTHRRFDDVILVFIVISSFCLAIEDPVDPDADVNSSVSSFAFLVLGLSLLEYAHPFASLI
jgi:hypothetical protein